MFANRGAEREKVRVSDNHSGNLSLFFISSFHWLFTEKKEKQFIVVFVFFLLAPTPTIHLLLPPET
jgi:hypothetical protein